MQKKSNANIRKIEQLYELANEHNIPVEEDCPKKIISMSISLPNGIKVVALSDIDTERSNNFPYTKLECFAHEMGHCMTDSFYEGYSPYELRAKHERRAEQWATEYLIPFSDLCDAVKSGCRNLWELAEHFDVSDSFMEKAIRIHEQNGNIVPTELYEEF